MKLRIIGLLMALMLVLIPTSSIGAATTANVTVNATPAFISISVNLSTYAFGVVATSNNYSTGQGKFLITNPSTVITDQTISVTSTNWTGGLEWTHSDTGTPGITTAALYASKDTGVYDIIVENASPNFIYENCPVTTNYKFELRLCSPTTFTDGVVKEIVVRVTAVAG